MPRICVFALLLFLVATALSAAGPSSSASIQATATVVQPVGISAGIDSSAIVIRYATHELPLQSEAFHLHRFQSGARAFVSQSVLVFVDKGPSQKTFTVIPISD